MALNLACESIGSGPPLVVLHGLFGSGSNWRGVARALGDSHTVHCADLRNHGASPWADSMGYAAMALALRHPQRIGPLIVVDVAPISYADTLTPFAEAMRSVDVAAAASRAEVQRRLQQSVPDRDVVTFLMQNLVARNDHFDWRLNLPGISGAMSELCAFPSDLLGLCYESPTTVIAGAQSNYVADRHGVSFAPMFGDVEIGVVENAGHWVHADQPAAFVTRVMQVLQRAYPYATPTH